MVTSLSSLSFYLWYDMSPSFINSFYLLILILSNLNEICNVTMLCAFKTRLDYCALWASRPSLTQVSLRDQTHLNFYNVKKETHLDYFHCSLNHEACPDPGEPPRHNSSKLFNIKKETHLDSHLRNAKFKRILH